MISQQSQGWLPHFINRELGLDLTSSDCHDNSSVVPPTPFTAGMVSNIQCATRSMCLLNTHRMSDRVLLGVGPLYLRSVSLHLRQRWRVTGECLQTHPYPKQAQFSLILTLARLPVTSQAKARPAPAGPCLVTVGQEADVRAATWLPILVILTGMTPH